MWFVVVGAVHGCWLGGCFLVVLSLEGLIVVVC